MRFSQSPISLWLTACITLAGSFYVGLENPLPSSDIRPLLFPRVDPTSLGASCRVNGLCAACKPGNTASCAASAKRDLAFVHLSLDGNNATELAADDGVEEGHLYKRTLQDINEGNIAEYLQSRPTTRGALGLTKTINGLDYSFTRQFRFRDYQRPQGLVVGVRGGFLTGCSILFVISRRAVYAGHFWQNLGFQDDDDPASIDFQGNVLNLISGTTPTYQATGDALDPTLFNRADDNTYAFWMTPRASNTVAGGSGGSNLWYAPQMQQVGALLQQRITNLRAFITYGYISEEGYDGPPYSGVGLFEYDPSADGNGNGNWRLFLEESMSDGISRGQAVVGTNNPDTTP